MPHPGSPSAMRARSLLTLLLLGAVAFAGCIGTMTQTSTAPPQQAATSLLAGPALWNDPQNAPHPAWGWATLSHPPAGEMPYWWQPINATALPSHITGLDHLAQAKDNQSKPL